MSSLVNRNSQLRSLLNSQWLLLLLLLSKCKQHSQWEKWLIQSGALFLNTDNKVNGGR